MTPPPTDIRPAAAQMARWLSALLAAGGAFASFAAVALPLPAGTDKPGLAGVGAAALVSAGVVFLLRRRLSPTAVKLLLPAVTALVGLAVLFDGAASSPGAIFYVWVVLYAAYFLSPRQAALQLGVIGVVHALVLSGKGLDDPALTRWSATMLALVVAGAVIAHLVGRLRTSLAAHAAALKEGEKLTSRLAAAANTDELTGVPNRRAWENVFEHEMARARRQEAELSVAILDLDRFKEFNDRYGHPTGDRRLREAAEAWQAELRESDLLARYGGEEFAVLLPDCGPEAAATLIERLREVTPHDQTVSAGLASWTGDEGPLQLVERADAALYRAKRRGRDRTVLAIEEPVRVPDQRSSVGQD
jgi:diguanylate cyclase (GGDEF)-like protein